MQISNHLQEAESNKVWSFVWKHQIGREGWAEMPTLEFQTKGDFARKGLRAQAPHGWGSRGPLKGSGGGRGDEAPEAPGFYSFKALLGFNFDSFKITGDYYFLCIFSF